jgi:4-oxalocrotonate tautomerase
MPTLSLRVSRPLDAVRRAALAEALTAITARTLLKQAALTAVLVESLPAGSWFIGASASAAPAAQLEIAITAGTNSAAQKAEFIAACYAELQRQLGGDGGAMASTSYVIVHELPAGDWGYGGQTQAARRLAASDQSSVDSGTKIHIST